MARPKVRNCTWYFAVLLTMYVTTIFMIQLQTGIRRRGQTSDLHLHLPQSSDTGDLDPDLLPHKTSKTRDLNLQLHKNSDTGDLDPDLLPHKTSKTRDLELQLSHRILRGKNTKNVHDFDWITYKQQTPSENITANVKQEQLSFLLQDEKLQTLSTAQQKELSIFLSEEKRRFLFSTQETKLPLLSRDKKPGSASLTKHNFTNFNFRSVNFIKVGEIYVYAGYVDRRLENVTVVRILAVQNIRLIDGLMCKFFNKLIVFADKYQMCENHGKQYGGWVYSCTLPVGNKVIPKHVHLSTISEAFWDDAEYPQLELPPLQYSSEKKENLIGVCVPPLFGNIPIQLLVNYIELMKILGVSKVFFYKYNISKSVENLLNYYSKQGSVYIYNWELPANITNNAIWYNGQLLTIQHCLYDNMAKFQFLMFVDLDEVLIPKKTLNLLSMLHNVVKETGISLDKISAFSFQSAFFDTRQLPDPSQKIPLFQHLQRSKQTSKVRTKLIVQTNQIFELGIHHLSRPIRDNVTVVHVDQSVALVHHYRRCDVSFDHDMRCHPTVRDESMLRYSELLEKRSNHVLKEILQLIY